MARRTKAETESGEVDPVVDPDLDPALDPALDPDQEPRSGQSESEEAERTLPPAPPAVSKWDTQLQRASLDLMPGWVGAFKDAMAKVNSRVPTDDEIAASIIAGAESFREKDADWRSLHP